MKTRSASSFFSCRTLESRSSCSRVLSLAKIMVALAVILSPIVPVDAAEIGKSYATPEEAVQALVKAATSKDSSALHAIFGPGGAELENPDRIQSTNELDAFTAAFNQTNRLARLSEVQYVLEVGEDLWPFPIPIVKKQEKWFFDTEVGKDELLGRRIGRNELFTLQVMRAYVDAQREYASKDHDGDEVLEYAQRISSSAGKKDGLYWASHEGVEESPLGPWVADAQAEGYFSNTESGNTSQQPFQGYYFKILTRQGAHAPGGKHEYIINGNMITGFGLLAWPAEYRSSGVMTFIVNHQGRVYQKDLGEKTASTVNDIRAYDPDRSWQISPD